MRTGAGELTGGEGVPQPPGLNTEGVMMMPAVHPFTGKYLLSTSLRQVLYQALGHSREQGRAGLSKEQGDKKRQQPGV